MKTRYLLVYANTKYPFLVGVYTTREGAEKNRDKYPEPADFKIETIDMKGFHRLARSW